VSTASSGRGTENTVGELPKVVLFDNNKLHLINSKVCHSPNGALTAVNMDQIDAKCHRFVFSFHKQRINLLVVLQEALFGATAIVGPRQRLLLMDNFSLSLIISLDWSAPRKQSAFG
jgi:hypothetical protein